MDAPKTTERSKMLFEEEEMLIVGDQLAWDPFGYGEVGVDHRVGMLGRLGWAQAETEAEQRVGWVQQTRVGRRCYL